MSTYGAGKYGLGSYADPQAAYGNLAATESGADTAALVGAVLVQGALAASEAGADTFSAEGVVRVAGVLAAVESGADTISAEGAVRVQGVLAATETGADTFSAEGIVKVQGAMAATESGADTFAAEGDTVFFTITGRQALRLLQIHLLHGLDAAAPLTVSPTARQAGAVAQTVAEASGTVTITTTAGATVFAGNPGQMIDELAALHGLTTALTVTAASRAAGSISQAIATAGDTTTVTRAAA